jgi:NitT/TauT family transport system substrate-binding protein
LTLAGLAAVSAVTAARADPVTLKIAQVVNTTLYAPLYVAIGKGFAEAEGIKVDLTTAGGGDKVGALMLSGQTDLAFIGPDQMIYLYNTESPVKPVLLAAGVGTDGTFFASRKKIDSFQWSMVDGKKIMSWHASTTPDNFLDYVLKKNGVDAATIGNIDSSVALPARDVAWTSGRYDFGVFPEPNLSRLERTHDLYFITSIGKEAGHADYTSFAANRNWVDAHPDLAQKWANTVARTLAWMKTASSKDIADAIAWNFPTLSSEDALSAVNRFRNSGAQIWSSSALITEDGLNRLEDVMVAAGALPADERVPYDKFVVRDFAMKADKEFSRP